MRVRFLLLPVALVAAAACSPSDDGVSVNERPPLGGVRFINAVADGGPVDIRMVDQVQWSASSVSTATNTGLPFRAGTVHWATEAKPRHIRVFPTDSLLAVTTQVLHDTTITIEADKNVTLMLVGSRVSGGVRFVMIDDTAPTVSVGQVAVRVVNASMPAAVNGYMTATTTSALPATPTFANVAARNSSPYVVRDTGSFAIRATEAATTTPVYSSAAPAGAPGTATIGALAGATGGGALSAYVFPRSVAGTAAPQTAAFTTPGVIFFVDKIPKPPTIP